MDIIDKIVARDRDEVEEDNLEYGPVKVIRGKYKGRIGCYDDDEGKQAYVYWGDIASVLDTGVIIRKAYLSNEITTYDLVDRAFF